MVRLSAEKLEGGKVPADKNPGVFFWVISGALLLWGIGGASVYVAYFLETPDEVARSAESPENREAYAQYVSSLPAWATGVGIVAAIARLLGALCLLLRRAWALPLYIVSLIFFSTALYRAFVVANAATVMSGTHIGVQMVFLALSVFAIWFAGQKKSKGILN
jgi:hypothetical protein